MSIFITCKNTKMEQKVMSVTWKKLCFTKIIRIPFFFLKIDQLPLNCECSEKESTNRPQLACIV